MLVIHKYYQISDKVDKQLSRLATINKLYTLLVSIEC